MILGIIAEYNPFHNGHLYHLLKSKEKTNADSVIAVIGGNFTQRGEVIELPTLYSTSSAENFADGAIKILNSLKIVDNISFGAETENLNQLNVIANVLYKEPKEYKDLLYNSLRDGKSYPRAREEAILNYLKDDKYSRIMSSPNNILGIEYLKALKKNSSKMTPMCIKRKDVGHLSLEYNGEIASATAIRNLIQKNRMSDVKNYITPVSYSILIDEIQKGHFITSIAPFEQTIIYNLRSMPIEKIANLPDVSEGLEYLIKKAANSCNSLNEFINIVSTKRYTETRIKRILLYSLLKITKRDISISKKANPYIRVLGFNENGKNLISKIKKANPRLNIITSVKRFENFNVSKNLGIMLNKDIFATNVYTIGYKQDSWSNLDYTKKVITL